MLEATRQAIVRQGLNPPNQRRILEDVTRKLNNYRRLYWDTLREDFPENSLRIRKRYPKLNWARFSRDYSSLLWEDEASVDFVHLEVEALKTIRSHSLVQQSLAARYSWWFIDEYQDLGQPFHKMMLCLRQNTRAQMLAIGDPDQCIYEELQGSKPELIYELSEVIQKSGGAKSITLKTNYRSVQEIIDLSEIILGEERGYLADSKMETVQSNCEAFHLHRSTLQSSLVRDLLSRLIREEGLRLDQIAILHPFRNGPAAINQTSYMLDANDFPNALDKDPEYNERRVKLISWIEDLASWCAKDSLTKRPYFTDLLPQWFELVENHQGHGLLDERFRHERRLFEALWTLRDATMRFPKWLNALRTDLQLDPIIESYSATRPDDAKEFFRLCDKVRTSRRIGEWNLGRFAKVGQRIQLTTLHSSKGAQFEAVIVAGFDRIGYGKRRFSPEAIDRRLAYVAVTRAKQHLFLLYSDKRPYLVSKMDQASNEIIEFFEYSSRGLSRA